MGGSVLSKAPVTMNRVGQLEICAYLAFTGSCSHSTGYSETNRDGREVTSVAGII